MPSDARSGADGRPSASFDFDHIDISDLSRHFGRRKAVARVSLSLRAGDILGLLGPNGAGKSTLLGMLATLVSPTSGTITYGGATAAMGGAHLRGRIGVLAHELHLYPELTARQNQTTYHISGEVSPRVVITLVFGCTVRHQSTDL